MKKSIVLSVAFLLVTFIGSAQIRNKNIRDNVGWQKIGEVKANYGNDHDAINVDGSFNDFMIVVQKKEFHCVWRLEKEMIVEILTYPEGKGEFIK